MLIENLLKKIGDRCADGSQAHHFIIDTPEKGRGTKGVCKKCGLVRKHGRSSKKHFSKMS